MKGYVLKEIGEVIDGFRIDSVLGYSSNEPVYSTTCGECGTSGVAIRHDDFRKKGKPRCSSSTHFSAVKEKLPQLSLPPETEPVSVNDYVANLKATRDAAETAYKRKAAEQWCSYIRHGVDHGWNLDKMIDIRDWLKVTEQDRQSILDKQASGYYEQKKEIKSAEKL